jgi:peptidoglycan/LPS O-acetylase OafA/YrhL
MKHAVWLWLPAIASLTLALFWAEDGLSFVSSAFGFFLVAVACGLFLLCAVTPRLPFATRPVPGAGFVATIAYSVYLTHKLAIHAVERLTVACPVHLIVAYLAGVALVLLVGSLLFWSVERPFLRVRERKAVARGLQEK